MIKLKTLAVMSLILLVSGCATFNQYKNAKKPKATVVTVTIADISFKSITFNTVVRLDNENDFDVKASDLSVNLAIAGEHMVTVNHKDEVITLPANGSTELALPITVGFAELMRAVQNVVDKSEVPYGVKGTVNIVLPVVGKTSVPLKYDDVFQLPKMPMLRFNNVDLSDMTIQVKGI